MGGALIVGGGVGVGGQVTAQTVKSIAGLIVGTTLAASGAMTLSDDITMSKEISKITHSGGGSGKLHIESTSRPVQIEDVTFTGSDMTDVGDITTVTTGFTLDMASEVSAITHSYRNRGQLTISSESRHVLIEDVTFTGSDITGAGDFTSNGDLTMGGALSGVTTLAASGATTLTADTASSSKTTGTLIVTGGVGVSGQVSSNTNKVFANTASSSTTTGALIVAGGVGVAGQVTSATIKVTATTASSTQTNGALIVGGGVGVNGQVTAETLLAIGTITSNDFFKTNNDKGIKGGVMTQATTSSCTGSVSISKWHGRIKITPTCSLSRQEAKAITVNWSGSPPASFEDSTIMLSQCGSDTDTASYQSATYRITIESSTQFKMQYATGKFDSDYTGTIVCYMIIWGV